MTSDDDKKTPPRTLKLDPSAAKAKKPADPFAPRRAPVRPPGPARAKTVSASAPKPPSRPQGAGGADRGPGAERPRFNADRNGDRPGGTGAGRFDQGRPRSGPTGDDRGRGRDDRQDRSPGDRRGPSAAPRPAPAFQPHRPDLARVGNVRGEVRLNKRMADLGLCSRREADAWIARGWVLVDGEPAVMGMPVAPDAKIEVLPQARHQQAGQVTILLNKPMGYVSGQPEDGHEAAATLIGAPSQWRGDARHPADARRFAPDHTRGLAPCGRLDIDSIGLLVLTQDGRIARQLIGDSSGVEKEYLVRVQWAPNGPQGQGVIAQDVQSVFPEALLARLRHGLSLDDQPLKPAQVNWMNPEQLSFVLVEGKKRQIRRMCEQVGLHVVGLKRIRIGNVVLGNLPVGQWRYLGESEGF
ncbi:pseudouridine synthase [Hydrogenophaga sp. PAMC20947]|uniref:pseudouridine synthase n=1 Tax=Hydrogenophaga sp. PAMC20947 TaxID=2565558 RepID=UPI002696EC61